MNVRIVKYSGYDPPGFDGGPEDASIENAPEYIMDEVEENYRALENESWRKKKEFLDDLRTKYYDNYDDNIDQWIEVKEDDISIEADRAVEDLITGLITDEARNTVDEKYVELYVEEVKDRVDIYYLVRDVLNKISNKSSSEEEDISIARDLLQKAFDANKRNIMLSIQQRIKDEIDEDVLQDTVRFMETPEESGEVETLTDPSKLENMPSSGPGLGTITSKKNNIKRGGKMLIELFKLAHTLDKKGEYELASEVDAIIKELSQRAGITPEEMISLANDLDKDGDTDLADKLDAALAKKSK